MAQGERTRYRMHPLVREYALRRLEESGRLQEVRAEAGHFYQHEPNLGRRFRNQRLMLSYERRSRRAVEGRVVHEDVDRRAARRRQL